LNISVIQSVNAAQNRDEAQQHYNREAYQYEIDHHAFPLNVTSWLIIQQAKRINCLAHQIRSFARFTPVTPISTCMLPRMASLTLTEGGLRRGGRFTSRSLRYA
jgi:hypothetical protein